MTCLNDFSSSSRTSLRTSINSYHFMTILIVFFDNGQAVRLWATRPFRKKIVTCHKCHNNDPLFNEISEFSSSDEIKSSNNHIRLSFDRIKSIGSSIREMLELFSKNKMMELLIDKIHDFNYHLTLRFQNRFQFSWFGKSFRRFESSQIQNLLSQK